MDARERILIIDDNEELCSVLRLIFEEKQYAVDVAATGQEALAKAERRFFHAILLDIKLPDMSGVEVLAHLKKMRPDTAVLMITAYASLESAIEALNEGASAYILKPVNMDEVLVTIQEVLEKQHLVHENRRLFGEAQRELTERKRAEQELYTLNATLEERVQQRTSELQVLYEFSQQIGHAPSYAELFHLMLKHLHRIVPHDVAAGLMVTDAQYELYLRPIRSLSSEVQDLIPIRLLRTFARMNDQSVDVAELSVQEPEATPSAEKRPVLTSLGSDFQVPFIAGPEKTVVGLLFLGAERENAFGEDQIRVVYTVASQAAQSIQHLQSLIHAEQLKAVTELAVTVNHELNQPLTTIRANSELLQMGMNASDTTYRNLTRIQEGIDRVAELVRRIGEISTYETTTYVPGVQMIDLERSVRTDAADDLFGT